MPAFYFQMNFAIPGGMGFTNILELNPNKMAAGIDDFKNLVTAIFGEYLGDLRISRVDLNADIEIPVDYLYRSLRIPGKRKGKTFYGNDGPGRQTHSNRGVTGFYIGCSPSQLRVYDKRLELKERRKDVSGLPPILTRAEWEFRNKRCPIRYLAELPQLLEIHPFDLIEVIPYLGAYDFHNDCLASVKRFTLDRLAEEYGIQDAARILNRDRNFRRDYRDLMSWINASTIKDRLHDSYLRGTRRFFNGLPGDPLMEVAS